MLAPIILFVYNRPNHTIKTIDALKQNALASESSLFIFSDGPQKKTDNIQIKKVREIIHNISGFKEIKITERTENMGLDPSVRYGVSEIINKYGKCIVLEDDIVTHPFFLRYINEALDKYSSNQKIQMVGGYNNQMKFPFWYTKDVFIAPRCCAWGWGTWKDRWDNIDWSMSDVNNLLSNKNNIKRYCLGGNDKFSILKSQIGYKVPAWDVTFDYTIFQKKSYVLFPRQTLTINIGCDGSGEHKVVDNISSRDFSYSKKYNIIFPKKISPNFFIIKRFKRSSDNEAGLIEKFIWSIIRRLK